MLFFENDYGYGAHPKVLEYLAQTNMEPVSGYGNDKFTASAAEKIKVAADCPDAQVYFLTGGTQTNMVVIDTLLRPYEGVVASSCGHVNTHEAGAIESTGHKVLTVPHTAVAAIMQEAHWLVSEGRYINKFYIEGFKRNEEIYIKYSDVPIDFRTRKWEGSVSE